MEALTTLSSIERQNLIFQLIERQGRISVAHICDQFSISEATARRDLDALSDLGKIQRVHGGAIVLQQAPPEQPMIQRQDDQAEHKTLIGRAAAELVKDGDTIFLGSGTTVLEVARALRKSNNLTVFSNSMPVINMLADIRGITLVCPGGMLRQTEYSFIGHFVEEILSEVRVDKVIFGVRAINLEQGLTNDYLPETMTDRAILNCGRELIVVADHTKFGLVSTVLLAPIQRVNTVVTDSETSQDFIKALSEMNIRTIIA